VSFNIPSPLDLPNKMGVFFFSRSASGEGALRSPRPAYGGERVRVRGKGVGVNQTQQTQKTLTFKKIDNSCKIWNIFNS